MSPLKILQILASDQNQGKKKILSRGFELILKYTSFSNELISQRFSINFSKRKVFCTVSTYRVCVQNAISNLCGNV